MTTALIALTLLAVPDIGVDSIIEPRGMISNNWLTRPRVLVANHGDSTTGFVVWLSVVSLDSLVYAESTHIGDLDAASDTIITFPDLNPRVVRSYQDNVVYCSLYALQDSFPTNDTMARAFEVSPPV